MADDNGVKSPPPSSLRRYLEAGGDFSDVPEDMAYWLAEDIEALRSGSRPALRNPIDIARDWNDHVDSASDAIRPRIAHGADIVLGRELAANEWTRELLEDAALVELAYSRLPSEIRQFYEEFKMASERPVTITCEERAMYRCSATGEIHNGWAVVLRGTAEWILEQAELEGKEIILSPAAVEAALNEIRSNTTQSGGPYG